MNELTTDQICKCIMPSQGSNSPGVCRTCGQSLLYRSGKISIIQWYVYEFVKPQFEGKYIVSTKEEKTIFANFEITNNYKGFFEYQKDFAGNNIDKDVIYWCYLPEIY